MCKGQGEVNITIIPLPFRLELNYFSFYQTFEKLFIICSEILINLKIQLSRFESQPSITMT
jgi:hypothetical protein